MLRRIGWISSDLVSASASVAVDVEGQHGVGAGVTQHRGEVAGVELEVLGVGAVAVQHRGHLAVAAGAARCALAGLGADRGGQVVLFAGRCLGHGCCSLCRWLIRHGQGRNYATAWFPSITVACENGATLAVMRRPG